MASRHGDIIGALMRHMVRNHNVPRGCGCEYCQALVPYIRTKKDLHILCSTYARFDDILPMSSYLMYDDRIRKLEASEMSLKSQKDALKEKFLEAMC